MSSIKERINNFDVQGALRREASRALYDEMMYLCHGLLGEVVGEDVFIYKLIREEDELRVQLILGWVDKKVAKFSGEPEQEIVFMRNDTGKPFYILNDRILLRVVR